MIAAIALRHGLTLVTGNLSHYQRIQALGYGLKLDNWRTYLMFSGIARVVLSQARLQVNVKVEQ